MWPFRPPQTSSDGLDRHKLTLDLIEQLTQLRGQVRAMEVEWDAVRVQIQKGWQRVEKANERQERRKTMDDLPDGEGDAGAEVAPKSEGSPPVHLVGFAKKLQQMKGA